MTMEWNNRIHQFDYNGGNGRESFPEHDECMREFRKSHADVALVNGLRLDEPALLESLQPLQVRPIMREAGGAPLLNGTMYWLTLIPVPKVARYKISQN